eukprot:752610-Hanusia_phi.AAC.1
MRLDCTRNIAPRTFSKALLSQQASAFTQSSATGYVHVTVLLHVTCGEEVGCGALHVRTIHVLSLTSTPGAVLSHDRLKKPKSHTRHIFRASRVNSVGIMPANSVDLSYGSFSDRTVSKSGAVRAPRIRRPPARDDGRGLYWPGDPPYPRLWTLYFSPTR